MIIGITGPECSGKDTAAAYLAQKGFTSFSLSDEIRKECAVRRLDTDTPTLTRVANELREQHGADVLAKRATARLEPHTNYVATSIRNLAELTFLRGYGPFILCVLAADLRTRYARHTERGGRSKYPTFESFVSAEEEQKSNDPLKQQLHFVFSKADYTIQNDGDISLLHRSLDQFLLRYGLKPNNQ